MRITVKNFGPIREARNVQVGPMTIFVGPSNTGKSYLATLIYSIMKALGKPAQLPSYLDDLFATNDNIKLFANSPESQERLLHEMDEQFYRWVEIIRGLWEKEINYCFGTEGRKLIRSKNCVVRVTNDQGDLMLDLSASKNSTISVKEKKKVVKSLQNEKSDIYKPLEKLMNTDDLAISLSDELKNEFRELFHPFAVGLASRHFFVESLIGNNSGNIKCESHYLPAVRGGIMQSHRALVNALIERAAGDGNVGDSSNVLFSGILSDFMKELLSITDAKQLDTTASVESMKISKIGRELDQKIIQGEINIKKSEADFPDFRYQFETDNQKYNLPLMNASSMVGELAPVSLYIHRIINSGDLFILEEPEAHLHPAAQLEISKTLVELVNAGVQVLITTHSDHILERIGNCMLEFNVQKSKKSDSTKGKTSLDEKNAFVYFFHKPKTGKQQNTTVRNIKFHPDTGILTKDHLDVSSALYNQTVDLYNQSIDYYDQPTESLGEKENDDD